MSEPIQLCVLCAIRPAIDREHVPAKGLFPKPRPDNLITVPACTECNGGSALDDEYLRSYFALRVEYKPIESLTRVRETAARAFIRPEHRGLQEAFARTMSFDWLPEVGGRVLTLQTRMTPDQRRVLRAVRKHARGLFYHVTGRILPAETKLLVMPDHKVDQFPEPQRRALDSWSKYSLTGTRGHVGEVFGYALRVADDNPNAFVLSLLYYKTFFCLVATRPRFFRPGPLPGKSWDHAANSELLKSAYPHRGEPAKRAGRLLQSQCRSLYGESSVARIKIHAAPEDSCAVMVAEVLPSRSRESVPTDPPSGLKIRTRSYSTGLDPTLRL